MSLRSSSGMTRRAVAMTAATIALATGAAVASAGTAQAYGNTGTWDYGYNYALHSWYNDQCLDDSNTGPNGTDNLRMFPCYASSYTNGYQKWQVIQLQYGNYAQLKNMATGRCLDWSPNILRTYPCNDYSYNAGYQKWPIVNRYTANGQLEQVLRNEFLPTSTSSYTCLDDSVYGVRGYPCNGTSQDDGYQGWNIWHE